MCTLSRLRVFISHTKLSLAQAQTNTELSVPRLVSDFYMFVHLFSFIMKWKQQLPAHGSL